MAIFNQWSAAIASALKTSAAVAASVTGHVVLLGDAREVLIRDVFSRLLPANAVVGTGQIIDTCGNASRQIDVIVYRDDFPVFRTLGHADVYLVEGVIAACEVKSTLTKKSLHEALKNVASVKGLRTNVRQENLDSFATLAFNKPWETLVSSQRDRIMADLLPGGYVFGFHGYRGIKPFSSALTQWIHSGHPGLVALPDVVCSESCVAVANFGAPFLFTVPDGRQWGYIVRQELTPLRFLLYHLLYKIVQATGVPKHWGTDVHYGLEKYLDLEVSTEGGWRGLYGEPPSASNLGT